MRLIDADALKEEIIDLLEIEWGYKGIREDVSRIIDSMPTVEEKPHGEWIPCSVWLPKEHHLYLTTIKKANGITFTAHSYFFTKEVGWSDDCVIAWMPLPEPYKRGETE